MKKDAIEILKYWIMTEMLSQDELPKKENHGEESLYSKFVFDISDLSTFDSIDSILDFIKNNNPFASSELHISHIDFYVGKFDKNRFIDYALLKINQKFERIEAPNSSFVPLYGFRCNYKDNELAFDKNSFSLSPIIWTLNNIYKSKKNK